MKKAPKRETLLPERKARGDIYRRISDMPVGERMAFVQQMNADMLAHPDHAALQRLEAALAAAHLHPDVAASREVSRLVFLFRELVVDFVPGETIEQALEPLQTLLAQRGGGRPPTVDHDAVRRHHARLLADDAHDATSQTAAHFGLSTRAVRTIVKG